MIMLLWYLLQTQGENTVTPTTTHTLIFTAQEAYYTLAALVLLGTLLWRIFILTNKLRKENMKYTEEAIAKALGTISEKLNKTDSAQENFVHNCDECREGISIDLKACHEIFIAEVKRLDRQYADGMADIESKFVGVKIQAKDDHFATEMIRLQLENIASSFSTFVATQGKFNERLDAKLTEVHDGMVALNVKLTPIKGEKTS
jgi:hypothetical protein